MRRMIKRKAIYGMFFLFIILNGIVARGQNATREHIDFISDRDVYFAGDQLQFFLKLSSNVQSEALSKYVYIELLDRSGKPVVQHTCLVEDGKLHGGFELPLNLRSDDYVLRAYTYWMRNSGVENYTYTSIRILNPYIQNTFRIVANNLQEKNMFAEGDILQTDKNIYKAGDNIRLRLNKNQFGEQALYLRVNRKLLTQKSEIISVKSKSDAGSETAFFPEFEQYKLSGRALIEDSREAYANKEVVLSIVGEDLFYEKDMCNDEGEFEFFIDAKHVKEVVVQSFNGDALIVEIDSKYDEAAIELELPELEMDSNDLAALKMAVINAQLALIFSEDLQKATQVKDDRIVSTFDEAAFKVVELSEYITLNSLEEVLYELVPGVSLKNQEGRMSLQMVDENRLNRFEGEPHVFLDGVKVNDLNKVFRLPLSSFSRLEYIDAPYLYQSELLNGVFHFVTKSANLSGFDFDHSIFRKAYVFTDDMKDDRYRSAYFDYANTLEFIDLSLLGSDLDELEFNCGRSRGDYLIELVSFQNQKSVVLDSKTIIVE